jgi:AraC-like DNA-binding protein
MPSALGLSAAINRLWLPRASLAACLRGVMARSTLGLILPDAQRFNHFPASPLCSIGWWIEGTGELLARGAPARLDSPRAAVPARIVFSGPQTRPTVSWNPASAHGMLLLLMPDALHRMTGIDIPTWVDRFADAREVLPPPWMAMTEAVLAEPDDDARVERMQDFIEPRWQAVRPRMPMQAHRYQDWAQALALRAASSGAGRSLRQVERRIKQWAGLPMRELRGVGRAEQAFFQGLAAAEEGLRPSWPDLAQASGYADQSHLCRETRRITGFTPDDLYRRIAEDECFWSYRLWQ